jgi:prepilin-type N-terminal cleavage/methylation domain-containing protein
MTRTDRGFSLVELMVAMTITLIVSAAIYGLLTSGSNAFRREPELADRQQNIRVAMDLVARDVFNAGAGLPTFSQVFTVSDPAGGCIGAEGLNGCGVMGTLGAAAAAARAPGDGQDPLENTDVLEVVATDEQCPYQSVCNAIVPGTAGLFVTREGVPGCMRLPGFALLTDNTSFVIQPAQAVASVATVCPGGSATQNGNLNLGLPPADFRAPAAPLPSPNPAPWPPPTVPAIYLYSARVVRYRIAPGLDPADPNFPALWRSETGRYDSAGTAVPEPGDASFPGAGSPWEIVARGIEDIQIEYMPGDNQWHNRPPLSVTDDYTSIVRQVRITVSARASAANLPDVVRGQLSTTVTPRAAFNELQMGSQIQ